MKVYDLVPDKDDWVVSIQDEDYKPVETLIDVFDKVVTHLLTQNKTSVQYGGSCQYRTYREDDTTLKCAVGCLISDKIYDEGLEDQTANAIDVVNAIQNSNPGFIVNNEVEEMMMKLQFIHDHCETNIWFYMAFLLYRDFNLFARQNFSSELMPVINNKFPDIDINQRNNYVFLANSMEKVDREMSQVTSLKEEYLKMLNSNKEDKETPFEFFKRRQFAFNNLIANKVITTTHY